VAHPHVCAVPRPYTKEERYLVTGQFPGRRQPVEIEVKHLWYLVVRVGLSVEEILDRYNAVPPTFVLSGLAFAYDNRELLDAEIARDDDAGDDGEWNLGMGGIRSGAQCILPFPPKRRSTRTSSHRSP
jgi:uncharacterized protein (DUF433 family)